MVTSGEGTEQAIAAMMICPPPGGGGQIIMAAIACSVPSPDVTKAIYTLGAP